MKCTRLFVAMTVLLPSMVAAQWTHSGLAGRAISSIAVGDNVLFAATADSGSLFRSTNDGASWRMILQKGVKDIAVSVNGSIFKVMENAVFRSSNGGETWARVQRCPPNTSLDISPQGTVFLNYFLPEPLKGDHRHAILTATHSHALFASTDDGLTWVERSSPNTALPVGGECMAFSGSMAVIGDIGADHHGFFVSHDDGITWGRLHPAPCLPTAMVASASGILSSCQDGLDYSPDMCATWQCKCPVRPTSFLSLTPEGVLGGTEHEGVVHFSDAGEIIARLSEGLANRTVRFLAMDPHRHLYAATDSGVFRSNYFTMRVSTDRIDLGDMLLDDPREAQVTIFNAGSFPLVLDSVSIDDPQFELLGLSSQIAPGESCCVTVRCLPASVGPVTCRATVSFSGEHVGRTISISGFVYMQSGQPLSNRWNLLSLPVAPYDPLADANYPGVLTPLYGYSGEYREQDTLLSGKGYWAKVADDTVYSITGLPLQYASIDVEQGWNLIGSLTSPVAVEDITSDPPGLMTSDFFSYDDGYHVAGTIEPGKGYWMKAYERGRIILSDMTPPGKTGQGISRRSDCGLPPPPPDENIRNVPSGIPRELALDQNYPNPFNPSTVIGYSLPVSGYVTLKIYSTLGQEVATLVAEERDAGRYLVQFDASQLPSGVYYYRMVAGSFAETCKLMIVK